MQEPSAALAVTHDSQWIALLEKVCVHDANHVLIGIFHPRVY